MKNFIRFALIMILFMSLYNIFYRNHHLTFVGPIRQSEGIGRQIIDHYNMLKNDGSINIRPTNIHFNKLSWQEKLSFLSFLKINQKLGEITVNENFFPAKEEEFNISEYLGINDKWYWKINQSNKEKRIAISYSMFEGSRLPESWVKILNKYYDLVAVPDPFLVKIYQESGVTKPIFVLPLGVDYKGFIDQPIKVKPHKIFTFANFSTVLERKNTAKLAEAFIKAFGDRQDVRLLISGRAYEEIEQQKLLPLIKGRPNIIYQMGELSEEEHIKLFDQVDCYVSISKGEGFSIIPRKAMALGIPTIVTDNTGQSTIAKSGLSISIPSNNIIPAYYGFANGYIGENYDCDLKDVVSSMLEAYNNYSHYLTKSEAMREWASRYEYNNLKQKYINLMIAPKKLVLGDKNEVANDYLMTDSKELYKKYFDIIDQK